MQPTHPPARNRVFLCRDKEITRCGDRSGDEDGGYAYFCPACGEVWGKVETGGFQWLAVTLPCSPAHGRNRKGVIPGSFLTPLVWWDPSNGRTLADQLRRADQALLEYEALRAAEGILVNEMPLLQQ